MGQNYLEIFRTVSDSDMRAVYEDMVSADAAGDRPRALDTYAKELQKGCGFESFGQAAYCARQLFYKETAARSYRALGEQGE